MTVLRPILGDQLSRELASLRDVDARRDVVLMMEVLEEATYVAHHKQKLVLVLSAMRHFAAELRRHGIAVDYVRLDDPANTGSLSGEVARALSRHRAERIVVTEASEWRVQKALDEWQARLGTPVEIREDDRFFATRAEFAAWSKGRQVWRMEHFYRVMRRKHGLLMDGGEPAGGAWNFDAANRKRLPRKMVLPERRRFEPDAVTREVMTLVKARFSRNVGTLDRFGWPVSRSQALAALEEFLAVGLPSFGDYQDAMTAQSDFLFHSLLSPALNLGLLSPRELCAAAVEAWRGGRAPLNAVEGFVRQILGWREFVRGVYWTSMPDYAASNALAARRPLPWFYWTGETDMRCMRQAIGGTLRHGYAHHIHRLMVTGNFALLAGVSPREIERWYLAVYVDAFEWVEMPNTLGMVAFADGGRLASKPYAASGAYIDRMSDYCRGCAFDVKQRSGPRACPFNRLYWAFFIRNEARLRGNARLAMPYRTLATWPAERRRAALADAEECLNALAPSDSVVSAPAAGG